MLKGGDKYDVRSVLVSTAKRDTSRYPHPSDFTYTLPVTLTNVCGFAIRDYSVGREPFVNEVNRTLYLTTNASGRTAVVLDKGDYTDINEFLTAVNTKLAAYHVAFVLADGAVQLQFSSATPVWVQIEDNPILRSLGYLGGICLHRGSPPGMAPTITPYLLVAVAEGPYDIWRASNMVVRITDVETIMSDDPVTNRASAVIFDDTSHGRIGRQCMDHCMSLLQPQSRLQVLRIKLLNSDGNLYDTWYNEATFLMEFYCKRCEA